MTVKPVRAVSCLACAVAACWLTAALLTPSAVAGSRASTLAASADRRASKIVSIARGVMRRDGLKAVILSVRIGGRNVVTTAMGSSMTGVRATTRMHFRSGAVAISYLTTVLLELVDKRVVRLNARLSRWLPQLRGANRVTLGMLAASRSGYADYVGNRQFEAALTADVFRAWTRRQLVSFGIGQPVLYPPGTSWSYSHTGFVILGEALEKITGKPIAQLIRTGVTGRLGLRDTAITCSAQIQQPVLHAFTTERNVYEDSTYWNPSWTLGCGQVITSNVSDLIKSAVAIGTGSLLSKRSHRLQIARRTRITPRGQPAVYYGLGIWNANGWLSQNPSFSGYQAVMAYLPAKKIAIAITTTIGPKANYKTNYSETIFQKIGAYLAPNQPPPQDQPAEPG